MVSPLLRTKPLNLILQEPEASKVSLKRVLGPWDLVALGIGCIIGVGIFVLPGVEAAKHAGPGIILSFVIAGAACACAALCYAELAAMIPVAGSAYTYGYATMGEFVAWIIGWDLILEYMVGACLVSIGWSAYLVNLIDHLLEPFGLKLPPHAWCADAVGRRPRHRQPPVRADRRHPHLAAGARDPRELEGQPRHGRDQGRGDPHLHLADRVVRQPVELDAVRAVRLQGDHDRRRDRLPRLRRVRRRVDDCRGGDQPAARHADRHHGVARRGHRALRRSGGDHDGGRAVLPARRR